jgi:hypothetical protein
MPHGISYSETDDQPAFTAVFDMAAARRADSFDKCYRSISEMLRALKEALSRLRQVSQAALLAEVPGVTQRRSDVPQNTEAKSAPKGP